MKRAKIYIDDIFCGILTEAPNIHPCLNWKISL